MANSYADYLIDHSGIDWSKTLTSWSWMLPPQFTVWLVTRCADLFLVLPDATIHHLDVGAGALTKVAESREEFGALAEVEDNAKQWFMIPLVDRIVAAGVELRPGQCYGFKAPPVLNGNYTVENVAPLPLRDYLAAYGLIHEQLQELADGVRVVLKVVE